MEVQVFASGWCAIVKRPKGSSIEKSSSRTFPLRSFMQAAVCDSVQTASCTLQLVTLLNANSRNVLDSLAGKTLRLNDDGSVPNDNPFIGQANART
jgi:hypothetical protein